MMTYPRQWSRCWLLAWLFVFSTAAAMLAQNPVPPDLSNSPSPHPTPLPPATVVSVVAKPFASLSGPAGGAFFITRAGTTSDSLTISYSLKGSALNGVDYPKLPGVVTIPAGSATVAVLIEAIAQSGVKTNRSVVLQLQPESAYKIGTPASAEMAIRYQNIPANVRPIVSLTASWVKPIGIKMDASVSDADGWVKRVEFFEGINRVGEVVQEEPVSGKSTLSFTWAEARPGNYYLTARATDNLGLSSTSTVARVTVPSISTIAIISPTNLTSFIQPADIRINATAIDPDGFIYQVNFYDANTKIGTSTLATLVAPPHGTPAHHSLEWKNAAPGLHTLYAEAKFASGITMRSEPVRVTVVKNPLTVKITSPTNDAAFTVPTNITLVAQATSSNAPAQKVEFFAGTKSLGVVTNNPVSSAVLPYQFTWSNAPVGNFVLTAKATDYLGFSVTSAPVNITVRQSKLPILHVVATDPHASDVTTNAGGLTIIDSGTFTIYRTGNTSGPVSVYFTLKGTAGNGVNYERVTPTVSIPAGVASTNILIKPISPKGDYRDSYVVLALPTSPSYTLANPTSAVVFIQNNTRTNNLRPSVQIRQPLNGVTVAPYFGNITIEVYANDADGWVQQVEVLAGTNQIGVATNDFSQPSLSTFRMTWTNPPPDVYSLTAIATDNRSVTATSAPVQITVTSRTNYLAITSPTNNTKVAAHANLEIQATAIVPTSYISLVEYYDGDTKIGQSSLTFIVAPKPGTPLHHSFTWTNVPTGSHNLIARAKDHTGTKIVSAPVHITTYLAESQLTINSPTNGASFTAPAKIAIEATAIDPNGYMNIVEFYAGQTRIGESILVFSGLGGFPDPGTPLHHTFVWSNVQMGIYTLTAKSVNKAGKTVTSAPVEIRVLSPVSASFVERQLPEVYQPGIPLTVRLKVTPLKNTTVYTVEDQPPAGWAVGEMNAGGAYDIANHTVKFGPFFDFESRTLTYEVKPPVTDSGKKEFIGSASRDGVVYPISGQSLINEGKKLYHPADNAPTDFVMTANEFTAYANAWKQGKAWPIGHNPIPASYVTQAGVLWKGGEKYVYVPSAGLPPLCWVNIKPISTTSGAAVAATLTRSDAAVCEMPATYSLNANLVVTIRVKPAPGTLVYTLEDRPPAGWTIGQIGQDGLFDPVANEVKWGPFLDDNERVLSYSVTPSKTASGTVVFTGLASFDGTDVPITGRRQTALEPGSSTATLTGLQRSAAGSAQLTFAGEAGRTYQIEATTDLVNWTSLGTVTGTGDALQFTDTSAANLGLRFYRAVPVP